MCETTVECGDMEDGQLFFCYLKEFKNYNHKKCSGIDLYLLFLFVVM